MEVKVKLHADWFNNCCARLESATDAKAIDDAEKGADLAYRALKEYYDKQVPRSQYPDFNTWFQEIIG